MNNDKDYCIIRFDFSKTFDKVSNETFIKVKVHGVVKNYIGLKSG